MNKIQISKSVNADTRTAVDNSKESLLIDTIKHIKDVQRVMNFMASELVNQGINHDFTKIDEIDSFYKDFSNDDILDGEWFNIHLTKEKHHPDRRLHDDITLLDLIEELVDKVVAGKGRTGEVDYKYFDVDHYKLDLAYRNTIKLIDNFTKAE